MKRKYRVTSDQDKEDSERITRIISYENWNMLKRIWKIDKNFYGNNDYEIREKAQELGLKYDDENLGK